MSLAEGGATTNSLPRSSSMMRGARLGSRDSCKKRIWPRRNSQSDSSSTVSDLVTSTALRRETTLMVMWSRISGVRRLSSAKGSGQASTIEGARVVGGGSNTTTAVTEVAGGEVGPSA
jgi:hypothetical protein